MPDSLQLIRPIDDGRLMQFCTDSCQRRDIDDGRKAHLLPDSRDDICSSKIFRISHERHGRSTEHLNDAIHDSISCSQETIQQADHDHRRDEMRRIRHALYNFLKLLILYLIEHQRQNDRRKESKDQTFQTENDRI